MPGVSASGELKCWCSWSLDDGSGPELQEYPPPSLAGRRRPGPLPLCWIQTCSFFMFYEKLEGPDLEALSRSFQPWHAKNLRLCCAEVTSESSISSAMVLRQWPYSRTLWRCPLGGRSPTVWGGVSGGVGGCCRCPTASLHGGVMVESPSHPTGQWHIPTHNTDEQTLGLWQATNCPVLRTQKGLTFSSGSEVGGLASQAPFRVWLYYFLQWAGAQWMATRGWLFRVLISSSVSESISRSVVPDSLQPHGL